MPKEFDMAEIKYAKAIERIEDIIRKIENEEIDIDELSAHVKEAATLVKLCRDKIGKAELELKDVVQKFEEQGSDGKG